MDKATHTITDENWPRHPDGRRKRLGELTKEQQIALTREAVARVAKEFQGQGVAVSFKGEWKDS